MKKFNPELTIIGAGVIDVLVGAVDDKILSRSSTPMDFVKISFGGDALNEAVVLSRFKKNVQWISKVGDDDAGKRILNYATENGLNVDRVKIQSDLETGVNIVMVDDCGERHFLTNPHSSLRKLSEEDIIPHIDEFAPIVSFASMFVSPLLDIPAMIRLFKKIKSSGKILAADATRAKNNETLNDLAELLSHVDYFFPNETELATLTGNNDIYKNISALLDCGLKCAVVKRGGKGCIIAKKNQLIDIPAYRVEKVIDTTGAGDSFAAGFLWALSENLSLENCGRFACAVASCSVEQVGAVTGVTSLDKAMARYKTYFE